METISNWWATLTPLNQWFFGAAAFFSVFFLGQLIMTIVGLAGGEGDIDTQTGDTMHHDAPDDAHDTVAAFKLLSVRSVIAFMTLFSWAGALYMSKNVDVSKSLVFALIWGVAAMILVSLLMHTMRKLAETGNIRIASAVGATGTVYLDIPPNGEGEIRVLCDGVMTHVKARAGAEGIKAGAPVKVLKVLGPNMVEVEIEKQAK